MKLAPIPDQIILHELLNYDPLSGKLFWKVRSNNWFSSESSAKTWNKRFAGKEAFTALRSDGYFSGCINYIGYLAHRVIFKWLHGYDPDQVDHDDRNRQNNRAVNLIDSSASKNSKNTKLYSNNSSGVVGVHWDKSRNRWLASIVINGRTKHLGRYIDFSDAVLARLQAEQQHNFHPNHGK